MRDGASSWLLAGAEPVRRRRRGRALLVGVAAVVALSGMVVARSRPAPGPATGDVSSAPSAERAVSEPSSAAATTSEPGFTIQTSTGASFTFPTGKPTALLFMAPACPSCMAPAMTLDRIERQLSGRIAVLGIDMNPYETEADLRGLIESIDTPRYGFVLDRDGRLTVAFGVRAPTVVFTDGTGRVVDRLDVWDEEDAFLASLRKAGLQ